MTSKYILYMLDDNRMVVGYLYPYHHSDIDSFPFTSSLEKEVLRRELQELQY